MTQRSIGIMQGRLVPPLDNRIQAFPRENWAAEFDLAAAARLDCIEWIYDAYGRDVNPLTSQDGNDHMRRLMGESGVAVRSVVADVFMDSPLVRAAPDELRARLALLEMLLTCCATMRIVRIVLPFVDASSLQTREDRNDARQAIESVLPTAERAGVEVHL